MENKDCCEMACSPSDWCEGGKCNENGCYEPSIVEKVGLDYSRAMRELSAKLSGIKANIIDGKHEND